MQAAGEIISGWVVAVSEARLEHPLTAAALIEGIALPSLELLFEQVHSGVVRIIPASGLGN